MNHDKKLSFETVRYDIHMCDAFADEVNRSTSPSPEQASELLRRCQVANASAQSWERIMRGVLPPKGGT